MHLPLPTLMSTAVGFMAAMAAALISSCVSGVYGVLQQGRRRGKQHRVRRPSHA